MASFTDTTPQFNPYVQQLPVEAMVQVGMQKQQQYNEGIQKIQTNIDNVAGMDVVRDIDKQYLQSKLNQLGNDSRLFAAADFSDFQMVNAVNGMTNQIVKDKNILNAVSSTARYRKGISEMDAANKEGKGSPSNDWDFRNQASNWLNSKDINTSFSGSYNPYTNYKKNALDVIKGLTKDESITDDAFTFDKNGNLVITDAITRTKMAGISPEKIQQALMAGLSPADFKQMEIDGRYNYSNISPEAFANSVNSSYKTQYEGYQQQRNVLENAKMSTTSNVERAKLDQQIGQLDKMLKGITDEYSSITGTFANGDVESAKARLHTTKFMNGFSKAFSYTETSRTYENSPFLAAQQFRETKAQDWLKFKLGYEQDERFHTDDIAVEKMKVAAAKKANELKQKELEGYGGLPSPVDATDVPKVDLSTVVTSIEKDTQTIESLDNSLMKQNGKGQEWLNQQHDAWLKSPSAVDPLIASHFTMTEGIRRKRDSDIVMVTQINKEAERKFGTVESKIPVGSPNLSGVINGNKVTFTPMDFVSIFNKARKYETVSVSGGTGGAGASMSYDFNTAKKELSPKDYALFKAYVKRGTHIPRDKNEEILIANLDNYHKKVVEPYRKTIKQINDFTSAEVTGRLTNSQGVQYGIPTGNTVQKTTIGTALTQFADKADELGGLANSPEFDSALARKMAVDPNAKYSLKVVEGTSIAPAMYEVSVTGAKGNTKFKITPEEKQSVFGNMFEASPAVQAIRPYQEQIRKMGGYSTGFTQGPTTTANAYLNKIDFPATKVYGVSGNIVTPDGNNYSIRVNVYDPVTKKVYQDIPYPRTGLMTEDQLAGALQGLSDAAIYELINDRPATASDLKQVENASKKPL